MQLPASGPLSLAQIQNEFGGSNPVSMSEYYRGGALVTDNNTGVPTSGAIRISNFYGTVKQFAFTINTNYTTTQDLRTLAIAAGWNGADPVLATVASGIVLRGAAGAANTGSGGDALTISGSFPAGVSLVNNGTILGGGGGGGAAVYGGTGQPGGVGGRGIVVSVAVSITNNNVIGGGGGGGGGGGSFGAGGGIYFSGDGGGGAPFGAGGSSGQLGPGQTATLTTGGGSGPYDFGQGGTGGNWGVNGGAGQNQNTPGGAGGAAGAAVVGNSFITWLATGTRYGPIS